MQRGKPLQDQLNEMLSVRLCHRGRHLATDNIPTRGFIIFDDACNNFGQCLALTQAENVREYQVLFNRHILLARPFIGPYEDITQEFDTVEFVNTDHGVYIGLLRNVDEGQRAQVVANKGMFAANRVTLIDAQEVLRQIKCRNMESRHFGWKQRPSSP
ncbi:MAG: hypothetical protein RLZZ464_372 [Pseudomonadota bacterium]|jgi:hypothetical protein